MRPNEWETLPISNWGDLVVLKAWEYDVLTRLIHNHMVKGYVLGSVLQPLRIREYWIAYMHRTGP